MQRLWLGTKFWSMRACCVSLQVMAAGIDFGAWVQQFMEERMQTTMVLKSESAFWNFLLSVPFFFFLILRNEWDPLLLTRGELFSCSTCRFNMIKSHVNCFSVLQLTGVLIGAMVAMCLIGIAVLFLYRRYKLASKFKSSWPWSVHHCLVH